MAVRLSGPSVRHITVHSPATGFSFLRRDEFSISGLKPVFIQFGYDFTISSFESESFQDIVTDLVILAEESEPPLHRLPFILLRSNLCSKPGGTTAAFAITVLFEPAQLSQVVVSETPDDLTSSDLEILRWDEASGGQPPPECDVGDSDSLCSLLR